MEECDEDFGVMYWQPPLYHFVMATSSAHFLCSALLFMRQRSKFPLTGHNPTLTLSMTVGGGSCVGSLRR